jgi:hypothetical protein
MYGELEPTHIATYPIFEPTQAFSCSNWSKLEPTQASWLPRHCFEKTTFSKFFVFSRPEKSIYWRYKVGF